MTFGFHRSASCFLGVVLAWTVLSVPRPAEACGGFFCSTAQPVVQSAERIIFAHNEDGSTTAVIQIAYEGPAERFAWLLPVVGTPTVGVSSDRVFTVLDQQTQPVLTLTRRVVGDCSGNDGGAAADASFFDASTSGDAEVAPPPVTVADAGVSGPYDYVTLSVDPAVEDKGAAVSEWLEDNDFDVVELGLERLVPYLEAGMNILALRLSKWADAGRIRPVTLDFGEGLPSIPLRATAAAATDDMGVLVWVLGEHRAIPANYAHIELNWVRLAWTNAAAAYRELVRLASAEAEHGFVTEFSGNARPLGQRIWSTAEEARWQALDRASFETDGGALQAIMRAAPYQGLREVLRMSLQPPPDVSTEDWTARPEVYAPQYFAALSIPSFDFDGFITLMEERVVDPIRETAALFESAQKATRFFTVMAPEQMTVDPIFNFDATRGDVSRSHAAVQELRCEDPFSGPWRTEVPGGLFVYGVGRRWPFFRDRVMPPSRRIMRLGPNGAEEVRVDNRDRIAERLEVVTRTLRRQWENDPSEDGGGPVEEGGCSTAGGRPTWWLLFGVALLLRRRRRENDR